MEVLFPHCAAGDVNQETVIVTVSPHPANAAKAKRFTRTFETFTEDLLALRDWLLDERVSHFAMEATGTYWKPMHNVLEGSFTTWVVNPANIKAVQDAKPT